MKLEYDYGRKYGIWKIKIEGVYSVLVVTAMFERVCGNMSQYDANMSAPLSIMSHSRLDDICTFILGI